MNKGRPVLRGGICLNTTQLECFLAVSSFLNFSRAAEQLRMTQPAVSHQINTLENELGTRQDYRTSKSVRLTQAGYLFTQYAGDILKLTGLSKTRLREYQSRQPTRLGIGCRSLPELWMLTPVLERLRREEPQLLPFLRLTPFHSLENLLEDGDIQVMFAFQGAVPKRAVYRQLVLCPVVCVCGPDHPLASRDRVSLPQLQAEGRVASCPPHCYPPALLDLQNQLSAGRGPERQLFCDNLETAYAMTAAGYSFLLAPDLPHAHLPGLRYIPLESCPPLSYGAACLPGDSAPALRRLLPLLEEVLAVRAAPPPEAAPAP